MSGQRLAAPSHCLAVVLATVRSTPSHRLVTARHTRLCCAVLICHCCNLLPNFGTCRSGQAELWMCWLLRPDCPQRQGSQVPNRQGAGIDLSCVPPRTRLAPCMAPYAYSSDDPIPLHAIALGFAITAANITAPIAILARRRSSPRECCIAGILHLVSYVLASYKVGGACSRPAASSLTCIMRSIRRPVHLYVL